jgi:hypothetical protein
MGKRTTTALVAALAVVLAAGALYTRARSAGLFQEVVSDEDRYYLPPPSWLRAFSLGYTEAVADVIWVTTIVYFGERAEFSKNRVGDTGIPEDAPSAQFTVNYLAVVTSLDPRFRTAYSDGARLTMYHKGTITRRTVEMAIELLERGLAQFPDDGEMAFALGFLCYYELAPFLAPESAELKTAKENGVGFIRASATMPGAPHYVSIMLTTLMRREGMDDLIIEHLRAMLLKETDPEIRASLEAQLRHELGRAAERDIALTRRLGRRWRAEMPFAPFDMFLMLEPGVPWSPKDVLEPSMIGLEEPMEEVPDGGVPPEGDAE